MFVCFPIYIAASRIVVALHYPTITQSLPLPTLIQRNPIDSHLFAHPTHRGSSASTLATKVADKLTALRGEVETWAAKFSMPGH